MHFMCVCDVPLMHVIFVSSKRSTAWLSLSVCEYVPLVYVIVEAEHSMGNSSAIGRVAAVLSLGARKVGV